MIKGNGPCNAERMANRRGAHEDGAWVREAADGVRRQAGRARTAAVRHDARPRRDWPLWEVFVRARRGLSHVHVGSLHAPDAEMALRNARDLYTRRQEGVSLWVVPAADITASSPDEKDAFFDPAARQDLPAPDVLRHPRRGASTCERPPRATYVARRSADDALVAGAADGGVDRRASPQLEEDVALGNIALDLLGQARSLLTYAGALRGPGRAPRTTSPTSATSASSATCSSSSGRTATSRSRWPGCCPLDVPAASSTTALQASTDETLAAVAAKAVKEVDYHRDHATQWVLRLGDGTDESHAPDAGRRSTPVALRRRALRRPTYVDPALVAAGVAVDPATLRAGVRRSASTAVLAEATLTVPRRRGRGRAAAGAACTPRRPGPCSPRCRRLARAHPGATW